MQYPRSARQPLHRGRPCTASGERYIPNFIENRLKFSPYIRNVAVLGAGRNELTAIVCIDFDAVGHWAEENRISYTSGFCESSA